MTLQNCLQGEGITGMRSLCCSLVRGVLFWCNVKYITPYWICTETKECLLKNTTLHESCCNGGWKIYDFGRDLTKRCTVCEEGPIPRRPVPQNPLSFRSLVAKHGVLSFGMRWRWDTSCSASSNVVGQNQKSGGQSRADTTTGNTATCQRALFGLLSEDFQS